MLHSQENINHIIKNKRIILIIPGNIRDCVVYCPAAELGNIYHGWDSFYVPF